MRMTDDERRKALGDSALEAVDKMTEVWEAYSKDDRYTYPGDYPGFCEAMDEIVRIGKAGK